MVTRKMLLDTIDMLDRLKVKKYQLKTTQIVQRDMETEEVIDTFKTVREASEATGFIQAKLACCVASKTTENFGGYIWRKELL